MSETDNSTPAPQRKERSPSFPFVGINRAVERAREVYNQARRHEVRMADLATAWGLGVKSSGTQQTVSALVAYGLLEDQGSGESRKLKITDLAFKALEDQRPGAREAALSEAALKPKLVSEYAEKWKEGRPSDAICISELRIDRGFSEEGAKLFLRVLDDNLRFTSAPISDKEVDEDGAKKRQSSVNSGDSLDGAAIKPSPVFAARIDPKLPSEPGKVTLMEGERVVFIEETNPQQYVKLVACGEVDETLLDALQDYVKRQKKRLGLSQQKIDSD